QHEEKRDEASAAVEGFDLPPRTADAHERRGNAGADPEDEEEACGRNGETLGDVVQNVVTGLVGEDEKDLVIGDAAGGGVPDHNAFGGADAGYIGIETVGLQAGLHQVHAAGRYFDSGAMRNFFKLLGEGGVGLLERLEFVKERVDEQRLGKDGNQHQGQSDEPCNEPVTARPATHHPVEEQKQRHADDERNGERNALILKPPPPALHADAVAAAGLLGEPIEGQADEEDGNKEEGKEN